MKRDEVASNQRVRLCGAMIEAVSRRGYMDTTVADVLALAGVSRRAFYELFSSKEDCFLWTHDSVVAHSRKVTLEAWAGQRGWAKRRHAACTALLEDMATSPKGPRLVLVDAFAVGPNVRARITLANRIFERMIVSAFSSAPDGREVYRLTSKAIVSGVRNAVASRLREGREREVRELTDDVLDMCECYHAECVSRLRMQPISSTAELARHTPAEFLLVGDERARSLSAVLHLTFDEGYASLTDPRLAQWAHMSTEVFHRHFAHKEEAFLALLDEIRREALHPVRERVYGGGPWPEIVQSALGAFLDFVASHEALMKIAFVELFALGPAVRDRMTELIDELTGLLLADAPEPLRAPLIAEDAVAGALWGLISSCVAARHLSRLPRLVEHLSFVVLAPYIGVEEAFGAIEAARPARGAD